MLAHVWKPSGNGERAISRSNIDDVVHRALEMNDEQKVVDTARRQVELLLELRCPRCAAVFVDFDGCTALTCNRAGCGCAFCAWCLKDCGANAHPHVRDDCHVKPAVEPGGDPFFVPAEAWMRVQRARQAAGILDCVHAVAPHLRRRVVEACRQVLANADESLLQLVHTEFGILHKRHAMLPLSCGSVN